MKPQTKYKTVTEGYSFAEAIANADHKARDKAKSCPRPPKPSQPATQRDLRTHTPAAASLAPLPITGDIAVAESPETEEQSQKAAAVREFLVPAPVRIAQMQSIDNMYGEWSTAEMMRVYFEMLSALISQKK